MEVVRLELGALSTNCYLVHREQGTLVIDPAADAGAILDALGQRGWSLDAVVLTHAHFDHMLALNGLPVEQVHLHRGDEALLRDPMRNLSGLWSEPYAADKQPVFLADGQEFMGFEVLHTPGHTPGGLCLYDWKEKELFSGDTMFQGSYGRTDFPGGDMGQLRESLMRLLGLPGESRVHPGHGAQTTIEAERRALGWRG